MTWQGLPRHQSWRGSAAPRSVVRQRQIKPPRPVPLPEQQGPTHRRHARVRPRQRLPAPASARASLQPSPPEPAPAAASARASSRHPHPRSFRASPQPSTPALLAAEHAGGLATNACTARSITARSNRKLILCFNYCTSASATHGDCPPRPPRPALAPPGPV